MLLASLLFGLTLYWFGSRKFHQLAERDRLRQEQKETDQAQYAAWQSAMEARLKATPAPSTRELPKCDDDLLIFRPNALTNFCVTTATY